MVRIPVPSDMAKIDLTHDCFGRTRFGTQRDDMGGGMIKLFVFMGLVGSMNHDCRTIYVAGLERKDGQNLEEILNKHFSEFGEVEQINVIYRLSIAFVRYRMRCSAEFAKVAMANQALDGEEVLNVRWAYEDPNPIAKQAIAVANRDAFLIGLKNQGIRYAVLWEDKPGLVWKRLDSIILLIIIPIWREALEVLLSWTMDSRT